jgi:Caspase domain
MAVRSLLWYFPLLLFVAGAFPASAEKRVALVIGNGKYTHAGTLSNPVNDATDMAAALKGVGFIVVSGYDLDKPALEKKIREFAGALAGADTGVFFYAGHGLQVAGTNYIVPVDAELSTADALEFEMIKLDSVQRIMENTAKTNILFLDACRNNPLARNLARALGTRGGTIGPGLAPAESGIGTLISFSTQPGNVAQDGSGRNSPYSGPLVKRIATPGEDILSVLTTVRNEVLAATAERQVPWENHALRAKFYFSAAAPAPASQPSTDAQAWAAIQNATSEAVLEEFMHRFPDSVYTSFAGARAEELKRNKIALSGGVASSFRLESPSTIKLASVARSLGASNLNFVLPEGHCLLEESNANDANFINVVRTLFKGAKNTLIVATAECGTRTKLRSGSGEKVLNYAAYYTPDNLVTETAAGETAALRKSLCDDMRKQGQATLAGVKDIVAEKAKELRAKIAVTSTNYIGVIDEDDHGCYAALLIGVKGNDRKVTLMSSIVTSTVIHSKVFFMAYYSEYKGPETTERGVQASKVTAAELDQKNP